MQRLMVPILLVAAVAACRPATTTLTEEQKAEIEKEVNAANAAYWDASRAGDWDREKAFYLQTPEFVWVSGGRAFWGYQKLADARAAHQDLVSQTFVFRHTETLAITSDVASVTAEVLWTQTTSDGVTTPEREFGWTAVWVRHEDGWKMHLVNMSLQVRGPQPG